MNQGMRIAVLRKEKGLSQAELSTKIGLQQSAISKIERGHRGLTVDEAKGIAAALGVSLGGLLSEEGAAAPGRPVGALDGPVGEANAVPLLSLEACCGPFETAVDDVIEWVPLPPGDYREHRYFLQAKGDSMSPTIEDGERILVDRDIEPQNGDIVVAVSQDESTIKRFFRYDERIELKPDNQAYRTIVMGPDDDLEIRGVAVCVQKRLRR